MLRHKGIVKVFDETFGCGLIVSPAGDDILLNKKSFDGQNIVRSGKIVSFLLNKKTRFAYKVLLEK